MRVAVGLAAALGLLLVGRGGEPTEAEQADLNRERVQQLIADGADVSNQDRSEQSAYLIATSEGYLELLELTLGNGADVTSLDSFNSTGFVRAAERGHADIVERLLETDIDVNHINSLGWTAPHEAIILGDGTDSHVRTVQLLLDHGADPRLPTQSDGQSPLTLAEEGNQPLSLNSSARRPNVRNERGGAPANGRLSTNAPPRPWGFSDHRINPTQGRREAITTCPASREYGCRVRA